MSDPLAPSVSLLVKLGSLAVHAEEIAAPGAHLFDLQAIKSLLTDQEVREWLEQMDALAFLPKKRDGKP